MKLHEEEEQITEGTFQDYAKSRLCNQQKEED